MNKNIFISQQVQEVIRIVILEEWSFYIGCGNYGRFEYL